MRRDCICGCYLDLELMFKSSWSSSRITRVEGLFSSLTRGRNNATDLSTVDTVCLTTRMGLFTNRHDGRHFWTTADRVADRGQTGTERVLITGSKGASGNGAGGPIPA